MSHNTGAICVKCGQELVYNAPPQETDTTTKRKIESGYYNCNPCDQVIKENRRQEREQKKQAKKQKQEDITKRVETQTETFDRLWHDMDENGNLLNTVYNGIRIVNLPNAPRLMSIYKTYKLTRSEIGFQAYEEANVVFRPEVEIIMQRYRHDLQQISIDVANGHIRREDEAGEVARTEQTKKDALKKLVRRMETLHSDANREELVLPLKERQRMVTDPEYKEFGKKVPRYHLLYDEEVYHRRQAIRDRRVGIITETGRIEKEICDENQKRHDTGEGIIA